VLDETSMTLNL